MSDGATAGELLDSLGINHDEVVILLDGKPIPEDLPLREEDTVEILRVVSGG